MNLPHVLSQHSIVWAANAKHLPQTAGMRVQLRFASALQLHRHQLYCSVADACQQGKINGSASALLSQLQAVLEAESCLSCIEEDSNAGE